MMSSLQPAAACCSCLLQLGHYLGLLHTHEADCRGAEPGQGDEVQDTAPTMQLGDLDEHMGPDAQLNSRLQKWCTNFRSGALPASADLAPFNSCPLPPKGQHATDAQIDAVFNLMSYVPAACSMLLTPGQVARLQAMVQQHRPLMMAAHATK
jgi:hypothetical protein